MSRNGVMTPADVRRALRENRRLGRWPWSMYGLAKLRGCSRPFVTQVMRGDVRSYPFLLWCTVMFQQQANGLIVVPPRRRPGVGVASRATRASRSRARTRARR